MLIQDKIFLLLLYRNRITGEQGGTGHWAVYYASSQSFIIIVSYSLLLFVINRFRAILQKVMYYPQ